MSMRTILPIRRVINIFGAIGYNLLVPACTIAIGVGLLQLAWSGALEIIGIRPEIICVPILPSSPPEAAPPSLPLAIKALDVVLTSVVTIAVLCAVIVLPYWLGRFSSAVLRRAIKLCGKSVTLNLLLFGKVLVSLVGAVLALAISLYDPRQWLITVVLLAAIIAALVIFAMQHCLAKISKTVKAADVW